MSRKKYNKSPRSSSRFLPVRTVLARITKNRPSTPSEFRDAGIKLRYIDMGVFRQVYKISGCPLVVKFPLGDGSGSVSDGIQHSISEVGRIKRLIGIKELTPHLPKIHYFDRKNGVLVMQFYPRPKDDEETVELLGKIIKKLVSRIARVQMSDIHADNVRLKRQNLRSAIFTDLGF
jgi:hypothetical protein